VVVCGTNAGAIVQAVFDDRRLHPWCTAVLGLIRVEPRAGSWLPSVMAFLNSRLIVGGSYEGRDLRMC
jgi:hypothetical protein